MKSIYIHGGKTVSGMGLHQPRLGASTKVLRQCIGVKGLLDSGEGGLMRMGGKAVRCERGASPRGTRGGGGKAGRYDTKRLGQVGRRGYRGDSLGITDTLVRSLSTRSGIAHLTGVMMLSYA